MQVLRSLGPWVCRVKGQISMSEMTFRITAIPSWRSAPKVCDDMNHTGIHDTTPES